VHLARDMPPQQEQKSETPQLSGLIRRVKACGLGGLRSTQAAASSASSSARAQASLTRPAFLQLLPEIAAFAVDTRLGAGCVYLSVSDQQQPMLGVDYGALEQLLKHFQLKEKLAVCQGAVKALKGGAKDRDAAVRLEGEDLQQLKACLHGQAFEDWRRSSTPLSEARGILKNLSRHGGCPASGNWPLRTRARDEEWVLGALPKILELLGLVYDKQKSRHVAFGLELTNQAMRRTREVELHARHCADRVELLEFSARAGLPVPFPPLQEAQEDSPPPPAGVAHGPEGPQGHQGDDAEAAEEDRKSEAHHK
jgi:hypothetical protein